MRVAATMGMALALSPALSGQVAEYEAKAEFLERFTRFVEWPQSALPEDTQKPFVLCVIGQDPFGEHLDHLAARQRAKNHPIEVRRLRDPAEATGCHMLFVAASEAKRLSDVLARTAPLAILTVGDTEGFARAGAHINLVSDAGRIAFEVNDEAARRSGLTLSSHLLRLARPVRSP